MAKNWLFLGFLIILTFIAVLPLFHSGLPPTHDGEYHVIRFYEFFKVLQSGNLYPRWAPDLYFGFGVPLFDFVYPLPNYIAAFLHFLGISFIDAFKLNMVFASIIGVIFFYLWTKKFWGTEGAIISSVFYTFSPYHFVDMYVRGSVGEVWALAFFPAFLWSITTFFERKSILFFVLSSIFFSCIIFSHNILALMFFIFSLPYIGVLLYLSKDKKLLFLKTLAVFGIGLMLSAIFWLPALYETQYVKGLQIYNVSENFVEIYELIIPSWGTGFSAGSLANRMSFQIGIANLFAVLLSMLVLFKFIKNKQGYNVLILSFFLSWFVFIFFLMLRYSKFIWNSAPLINYFQFPWRFLSLEILICSFLAGSVVSLFAKTKYKLGIGLLTIILCIVLGISYTKPAYYHQRNDAYYISRSNFIDGTNSPGNFFNTIWNNDFPKKEQSKAEVLQGDARIKPIAIKPTSYDFAIFAKRESPIQVNISYFPGWEVLIDTSKTNVSITKNGRFAFILPKGNHRVQVRLNDTMVRLVGKLLFFLSLVVLLFLITRQRYLKT